MFELSQTQVVTLLKVLNIIAFWGGMSSCLT